MGQKDEGEALRLIGLTYDTALGGHDWTGVLKPLAASIGTKSAILRMVDYTEQQRLDNFPNDHQGVDACI